MQDLYMATVEKAEYIQQQGYQLRTMWECEVNRQLANDEEMKRYFDHHEAVESLQPRDGFYGGRVNYDQTLP